MVDERTVGPALSAFFKAPARVAGIAELAGDASTRRYYRIRMAGGFPVPSVIVMEYPDDLPPGGELPFVNVHRYLRRAGVPVPEIYSAAPGAKLLFLEDAGDLMLEGAVAAAKTADEYLAL